MTIIKTEDLKKSCETQAGRLNVLKGISVEVREGEFIAVTGASGAGKSTFLHILGTIDRPSSGKVFYEHQDVFAFDDDSLSTFRNREVGFVFQFHHLLPEFSALENIVMPGLIAGRGRIATEEKAATLMTKLGIYDRRHHRPGELSGGEQQRVAVARALIMDPKAVFADEPTGNLDTATGDELFNTLMELNESLGTTFIMVTHNEALAGKCSRILHMKDGIIT